MHATRKQAPSVVNLKWNARLKLPTNIAATNAARTTISVEETNLPVIEAFSFRKYPSP
jgi:hypothetical protein